MPSDTVRLVREFNERYINTGDPAAVARYLDADCLLACNGDCEATDRAGYHSLLMRFRSAFPDLEHSEDEIFESGDRVVERFTTRGTHLGEFEGVAPSGVRVEFTGTSVFRIRDGRIAEERTSVDLLTLLSQIGGIPAGDEAAV